MLDRNIRTTTRESAICQLIFLFVTNIMTTSFLQIEYMYIHYTSIECKMDVNHFDITHATI